MPQRGRAVHYIPDEKSGDAVPIPNANPVFKTNLNLPKIPAAQSLLTLSYYYLIYLSKEEDFDTSTFGISSNSISITPVPLT